MMKEAGETDSGVWTFTWWWFALVFLCATQDIAVDGKAPHTPHIDLLQANNKQVGRLLFSPKRTSHTPPQRKLLA